MTATPELLARGKSLFAKNCAQCHGESGRGDGPAAKTAEPPPRDFSQPKGWKRGYGLAMVLKTISAGSAGTAMAAFDYIQPKDRMALAHYVQSLGAFLHPEAPQALAALARSFASSGLRVPNKIPVSLAMKKLAEEQVVPRPLRLSGAAARAISDPQRAAVWLQNSTVWRKGSRALAEAALAQAPDNGFSVAGAQLTPADWGALFDSIRRR